MGWNEKSGEFTDWLRTSILNLRFGIRYSMKLQPGWSGRLSLLCQMKSETSRHALFITLNKPAPSHELRLRDPSEIYTSVGNRIVLHFWLCYAQYEQFLQPRAHQTKSPHIWFSIPSLLIWHPQLYHCSALQVSSHFALVTQHSSSVFGVHLISGIRWDQTTRILSKWGDRLRRIALHCVEPESIGGELRIVAYLFHA